LPKKDFSEKDAVAAEEPSADAGDEENAPKKAAGKKSGKNALAWLKKEKNAWIAVGAIICIAVIFAGMGYFAPKQQDVSDFWSWRDSTPGKLKMFIITSGRCPGCEENNSIEQMFKMNNAGYAAQKVEETSPDGKEMIAALGIAKLPAYVIDERSITNSMLVKTKNSGLALLKDVLHFYVDSGMGDYNAGIFVFPELFLDSLPHSSLLLGEPCGNKNSFVVNVFTDPYCPQCIARSVDMENIVEILADYNALSLFLYNYLPTESVNMELRIARDNNEDYISSVARENVETAGKSLVCAGYAGVEKFVSLEKLLYGKYCDLSGDSIADANELENCAGSSHWGKPLLGEEVMDAVQKAGLSENIAYLACMDNVETTMRATAALAKKAGIGRINGATALVNCTYEVPVEKTIAAACAINSSLSICKTAP